MKTIILSLMASAGCFAQQVDWVSQVRNKPVADTRQYNFSPQAQTSTIAGGSTNQAAHFAPCPLGVNGTDVAHYLYVSTVGTPEAVLITGGTCTAGAATGTVLFTPQYTHAAGWKIASATGGVAEAQQTATTGGTIVLSSPVTATGQTTISNSNITLQCTAGATMTAGFNGATLVNVTGSNVTIKGCTFDGNQPTNTTSNAVVYVTGNYFTADRNTFKNSSCDGLWVYNGTHATIINNVATGNMLTGLHVTGTATGAAYAYIAGNYSSSVGASIQYSGAIAATGNYSTIIGNNVVTGGNEDGGIYLGQSSGLIGAVVADNVIQINGPNVYECSCIDHASGSTFTGNYCYVSGSYNPHIGFELNSNSNSTVTGNTFVGLATGVGTSGMYLENVNNVIVSGNSIRDWGTSGWGIGLQLWDPTKDMSYNEISSNTLIAASGNTDGVISVDEYCPSGSCLTGKNISHNVISNNNVKGSGVNTTTCIEIASNSDPGATVSGNVIKDNVVDSCQVGINTYSGSGALVSNNVITNTTHLKLANSYSSGTRVIDYNGITVAELTTLGTLANGSSLYLTDANIANPCTSGGSGAMVKVLAGVKVCN